MNLIIDIGNSATKVALVDDGMIIANDCYTDRSKGIIARIIEAEPRLTAAIISSTRQRDVELERYVSSKITNTIFLDHTVTTPLVNRYQTPETLGMDRLAAAVGAWSIMPNAELLIVDIGTAITIDHVSREGEYLGGNISPGLQMRFEALNKFTDRLPLVNARHPKPASTFGTTTKDAIWNGVVRGIELEIRGYIAENPNAKLFITGGGAKYFGMWQENAIFADYQLVVRGLDRILEHNA